MSIIKPFKGFRPTQDIVEKLASDPSVLQDFFPDPDGFLDLDFLLSFTHFRYFVFLSFPMLIYCVSSSYTTDANISETGQKRDKNSEKV